MTRDLLTVSDTYLDAVAAQSAEVVDVGPLRAFVSRAPWPYYVRPVPGLPPDQQFSADDVHASAAVLASAGHAVSFEWVQEQAPLLAPALRDAGYVLESHPLLALTAVGSPVEPDPRVRLLGADDADLCAALAVAEVAFASPGTAMGDQGLRERDAVEIPDVQYDHVRDHLRREVSVIAVGVDESGSVVASGWHQPVRGVSEIVGVATLPAYRRRGLAAAVVQALVADARARAVHTLILGAGDDDVARVYEGVGFVRIGHVGYAAPGSGSTAATA